MLKVIKLRSILFSIACLLSIPTHAIADPKPINIPPGDLTAALALFAKQTGAELVYQPGELKGLRTHGVSGVFEPQAAIIKLLEGTPLALHTDSTGVMLIAKPSPQAGATSKPGDHPQQSINSGSQRWITNAHVSSEEIVAMTQKRPLADK